MFTWLDWEVFNIYLCWHKCGELCTSVGWNDEIVALEKMTWFHFHLMKTGFLFVVDHLLVGQLCTNPKSDRSLLSCLKMTQCSTSEIGDVPLYNSCSLPIQVMTTGPLPAPSKCKSGWFNVPRGMKTQFPATVMVFGVVSREGHIMPPYIFKVSLKVNTKVYLDVLKSVVIPWCNQVAGGRPCVWQQDSVPAHKSKETQAWLQKECYNLVLFSHWSPASLDLNPLDYFVWSYIENITNMTSHNTKASLIAAIRRAPTGACGKGMLPVPDPYRGGDWGWRRLHWIDVSSTT